MHPHLFHSNKKHPAPARSRFAGFSMIDMIVALSIFIALTSVLLFKYNTMNTRLTLDTLAHQIAQWTRETQVSAMSVKSHAGSYSSAYGLHFDTTNSKQFIFFADLNGDKKYTPGGTCGSAASECVQVVPILKGNVISAICGESKGHAQGGCPTGLESLVSTDITFKRPDPDAYINGEFILGSRTNYARNQIIVKAVSGYTRTVEVWTTGQVSVK